MEEQLLKEQIERFLNNEMDASEQAVFEEKLAADSDLRDNVADSKAIIFGLKGAALRKEIAQIHFEEQNKKTPVVNLFWVSGIAASLLILLAVWWLFPTNHSNEELFASNFEPYPNLVSLRNSELSDFSQGMKYYTAGKFELAIPFLENEDIPVEKNIDRIFYLGLSNLALNNSNEAIQNFESLREKQIKYEKQVTWYLALAYLINDDNQAAINTLNNIKSGDFKYNESIELLQDLE